MGKVTHISQTSLKCPVLYTHLLPPESDQIQMQNKSKVHPFKTLMKQVATVFMALFGVNFSCYYLILLRQIRGVFKDEELRLYLGLIFGS